LLTLVKFYADWCAPCKAAAPLIKKLADEQGFILTEVNIDDNPGLRQEHHVRSIPTLLLFENGMEIGRKIGQASYSELEEWASESRLIQSEVLSEQSGGSEEAGAVVRDGSSEPEDVQA
jgi:thioredoxin 1